MLLFNLPLEQIHLFMLVMVRVGAILFTIPFLDARNIPVMIKAGLAVAVSILLLPQLMPQLSLDVRALVAEPLSLALGLLAEVALGVIIGLAVKLLFAGIQLAGQLAGFQMGFAIANVVDPASSLQIPILSQFLNLFALMIFLSINAHHHFIKALVDSFVFIPPLGAQFNGELFQLIMQLIADVFIVAVKIGAPVMVAMLLTSVTLGLMAKTVPQMQIFIVAMPLKILLGFIFLGVSLPFCATYLQSAFVKLAQVINTLIRIF